MTPENKRRLKIGLAVFFGLLALVGVIVGILIGTKVIDISAIGRSDRTDRSVTGPGSSEEPTTPAPTTPAPTTPAPTTPAPTTPAPTTPAPTTPAPTTPAPTTPAPTTPAPTTPAPTTPAPTTPAPTTPAPTTPAPTTPAPTTPAPTTPAPTTPAPTPAPGFITMNVQSPDLVNYNAGFAPTFGDFSALSLTNYQMSCCFKIIEAGTTPIFWREEDADNWRFWSQYQNTPDRWFTQIVPKSQVPDPANPPIGTNLSTSGFLNGLNTKRWVITEYYPNGLPKTGYWDYWSQEFGASGPAPIITFTYS